MAAYEVHYLVKKVRSVFADNAKDAAYIARETLAYNETKWTLLQVLPPGEESILTIDREEVKSGR